MRSDLGRPPAANVSSRAEPVTAAAPRSVERVIGGSSPVARYERKPGQGTRPGKFEQSEVSRSRSRGAGGVPVVRVDQVLVQEVTGRGREGTRVRTGVALDAVQQEPNAPV